MLTLSLHPLWLRLTFLLALTVALIALSSFLVGAAIGDSYVVFAQRATDLSTVVRLEGADKAVRHAARDPLVHYRRGLIYLNAAPEDETESRLTTAVTEMREAVKLSPEDNRLWIALGQALDHSGAAVEAQAAFEQARQLAPHHFQPQWALGNHWLRVGDREAAFAQFRAVLAVRPTELPQVFGYAWQAYNGDASEIVKALSPPPSARAELASLLISRDRVDEALKVWREVEKPLATDVKMVTRALINKEHFTAAHEVWRTSALNELPSPDEGSLLANGGFDKEISLNAAQPFLTWQMKPQPGVTMARDSQEHKSGAYSLRVSFDLSGNPVVVIATQTVPIAPATTYRLSFAAQTEELRNLSPPLVEVYDAARRERLHVESKPIMTEKKEWHDYSIEFTTTASTEAVTIQLERLACSDPPCPLRGRIWFDDFKLEKRSK